MQTIENAMLEDIYIAANSIAKGKPQQTIGEKNDFYITLQQLEAILKQFEN